MKAWLSQEYKKQKFYENQVFPETFLFTIYVPNQILN